MIGRFTTIDPSADEEEQESWSPYHYVYNNPIKNIDPDGRIPIETIWDVGNVLYDVGAAVVNHVKGDHKAAKSNWIDAGMDVGAVVLPYVPAGASKLIKVANKASDIKKIGPAGDAGAQVTKQIPKGWTAKTSKNGQGTVFKDPKNPAENNVRVQSGNPKSPNPGQQNHM